MTIEINTEQLNDKFTEIEQLAILAFIIETAYRYDYEAIARRLEMPGRTIFAGRGSWRTKGMLMEWILLPQEEFLRVYGGRYNGTSDADIQTLIRKRQLLEQTLATVGINRWINEFLKVYNLSWMMQRISTVLEHTRPNLDQEAIHYNLNLSLEAIR